MSRFTQVLSPSEVKFLLYPDSTEINDETFTENKNENKCEDQDEDDNFLDEEVEDEEEYVDDEDETVEEKPMPVDPKLKQIIHENINELIPKIQLISPEGDKEHVSFEDTVSGKNIQEKKKKAKQATPKQERKPTTKANKQGKKQLTTEKSSKNIEESKSKKNKNKKAVTTKEENITDDISHSPNSVDHNAETKQKKGRNIKHHSEEEAMKNYLPAEKEELPTKKKRGKQHVSCEAHVSHDQEDSKSRKIRKAQKNTEQFQKKEDSSEDTKKQNKAEEAASTNSKDNSNENKAKVKFDKGKSKHVDNSGAKGVEPKVTENKPEKAGKSVKSVNGKQTNTAGDLKINKEDGVKKHDAEIKENIPPIADRPKRNITKKCYADEKVVATAPKVKKETKVKQSHQSQSSESQIGSMIDGAPVNNEKSKLQQKGKKALNLKKDGAINDVEKVKKPVSHKK